MRPIRFLWTLAIFLLLLPPAARAGTVLFADNFDGPNGLITNEYAFWNPGSSLATYSKDWDMTSGTLFRQGNQGWTGIPDGKNVDPKSALGTNSAIFRLDSKRSDFGDVSVSFKLLNQGLSTSPATPAVAWDGIHIWLHYQSQYYLYYTSINRRDGTCVIKKKVPGGTSNGGTYYELTPYVPHSVKYNQWVNVMATAKNNSDGSVSIALYENGNLIVSARDDGSIGGPPIRGQGHIGIRGDNANLKFDDLQVTSLLATTNPLPVATSLSPAAASAGSPALPVTVSGSGFSSGSVIRWKGISLPTTYISAAQLRATIPAGSLTSASIGTAPVTVFTAAPGGGTSGVVTFTINAAGAAAPPPVPVASSVSPASASAGSPALPITVTGSGFASGSVVRWKGISLPTTFVSATQLQATIPAGSLTVAKIGPAAINVFTPAPGGGTSATLTFTIIVAGAPAVPPVPVASGLSPTSAYAGSPAQPITVSGSGFVTSSVVRWKGIILPTTFVSVTQLQATIPAGSLTLVKVGPAPVDVYTAAPGGGTSDPLTFSINAPARRAGDISAVIADLDSTRVFPNPWRVDRHSAVPITFDQLTTNSTVKIFDLSGTYIRTLSAPSGSASWDRRNTSGDLVGSGLYLYLITNDLGQKTRGKFALIR